jgi:hypothetical protein
MLVPSSHTSWLLVKDCEGVEGPFHFMISVAMFNVEETSVRNWSRVLSRSSTVGFWEDRKVGGKNSGWKPYQILKGECLVAEWDRMLWANSAKGKR